MIIVGAKGFAKEVLEVFSQMDALQNLVFFDDVSQDLPLKLYDRFPIIRTYEALEAYMLHQDPRFVLGVGTPKLRKQLHDKLVSVGGELSGVISPFAQVGTFGNTLGAGCCIMTGAIITNDVSIGKGCLINLNCTIGHDSKLHDFVELSPNVNVSGRCQIGSYTSIGTNAVLIPDITIGTNCIVAAGAVVTKDVPDNCLVAGIPAQIKKTLTPLKF